MKSILVGVQLSFASIHPFNDRLTIRLIKESGLLRTRKCVLGLLSAQFEGSYRVKTLFAARNPVTPGRYWLSHLQPIICKLGVELGMQPTRNRQSRREKDGYAGLHADNTCQGSVVRLPVIERDSKPVKINT